MSQSPSPRRIVLVDSSSPLHRSYHGYPSRTGMLDGQSVEAAALYGYVAYIRDIERELEFDGLIHVLDNPEGSALRKQIFPDYKGNRNEKTPELIRQEELLAPLLSALGQRVIQSPGVEADDLVASLAKKFADMGDEVLVITADKDLMQLVDDGRICLANYKDQMPKGQYTKKTHEFIEEAQVIAKLGIRPDQVADYLALVGDAVDNIEGVKGVGPKTATAWLNQYGSLASLMTNADSIPGASGAKLRAAMDQIPMYRQLTGCFDVDVFVPPCGEERLAWARELIGWPTHLNDSTLPSKSVSMREDYENNDCAPRKARTP